MISVYVLNYMKRVWIVKQRLKGISPGKIALAQGISEGMVRRLVRKYEEEGWDGLKDHKTGRPETSLNRASEIIILDLRKRFSARVRKNPAWLSAAKPAENCGINSRAA